jgi:hypothetical protein
MNQWDGKVYHSLFAWLAVAGLMAGLVMFG